MSELAQRILDAIRAYGREYIRVDTMMFLINQDFPSFEAFDKAVLELATNGFLVWEQFKGYRFIEKQP